MRHFSVLKWLYLILQPVKTLQKPSKNPKFRAFGAAVFSSGKAGWRTKFLECVEVWFGDILQVLFSRFRCSTAWSPWKQDSPYGFSFSSHSHQISSCKMPPKVCCLHNSAFLVKQKGIFFPPGWGQRMPGKIKRAQGLWCRFGRGDNGATQGGSSSTPKICSQYFHTWILGITCTKQGSSLGFWKFLEEGSSV